MFICDLDISLINLKIDNRKYFGKLCKKLQLRGKLNFPIAKFYS